LIFSNSATLTPCSHLSEKHACVSNSPEAARRLYYHPQTCMNTAFTLPRDAPKNPQKSPANTQFQRLEIMQGVKALEGSNPSLSAIFDISQ